MTKLLFPFVTDKSGFDTGIAISHTSEQAGPCTVVCSGEGPEDQESSSFEAERQTAFLLPMGGGDLILDQ